METVPILTDNTRLDHAQVLVASSAPKEEPFNPRASASSASAATAACCRIAARPVQREFLDAHYAVGWLLTATKTWPTGWPAGLRPGDLWSRVPSQLHRLATPRAISAAVRSATGPSPAWRSTPASVLRRSGIADHAAQVAGRRTGYIGEQLPDHSPVKTPRLRASHLVGPARQERLRPARISSPRVCPTPQPKCFADIVQTGHHGDDPGHAHDDHCDDMGLAAAGADTRSPQLLGVTVLILPPRPAAMTP